MAKTHIIKVRVTKDQHERVRNAAQQKGYISLAPYVRDILLNSGAIPIERRLVEINHRLERIWEVVQ